MAKLRLHIILAVACLGLLHSCGGTTKGTSISLNEDYDFVKECWQVWKEYKCIHIMRSDELPYDDCFIVISNDKFYYFRDKQLLEEDSLTLDKSYSFIVYRRQNKPDDIIQFLTEEGDSIALFRYKFDGEKEFFKKHDLDSVPPYIKQHFNKN